MRERRDVEEEGLEQPGGLGAPCSPDRSCTLALALCLALGVSTNLLPRLK